MVKFIRYAKLFRLYEAVQPFLKYSLIVEDKLPAERILAFGPHPDDETIGCGGTVLLHTRAGKQATIAWCTSDGEPRDSESAAAAKILGASATVSFKFRDGGLAEEKALVERIVQTVEETRPEIIFLPFLLDNHADHRALNEALVQAGRKGKIDAMIYAYPVWFPLYPNLLVNIESTWEDKKRAIECYQSQLATRDYITMGQSLARYWAEVKGHGYKYMESFFRATMKEYISVWDKVFR